LAVAPVLINVAECCHIKYAFQMPFHLSVGAAYVVATCGSLFFSSHRWVKIMSVAVFAALLVSFIYARFAVVSVWCYFAAILSVMVFVHLRSVSRSRVL
jgi:hypothetical protein